MNQIYYIFNLTLAQWYTPFDTWSKDFCDADALDDVSVANNITALESKKKGDKIYVFECVSST